METSAKISVIIPVYNAEDHLKECLDSIITQTLREIEIICVDDGSTDGSSAILYDYANRDPRFKILKQENQGSGPARNYGLRQAKGDYVCFMDADDFYPDPKTLNTLYLTAAEMNVKVCGGSMHQLYTDGTRLPDSANEQIFTSDGMRNYSEYQCVYGYQRFIFLREMLIRNNIFFPNYRRFQDPPFMMRAMHCAGRLFGLSNITYIYRLGHKKINWTLTKARDCVSAVNDCLQFAREHGYARMFDFVADMFFYHCIACFSDKLGDPDLSELLNCTNAMLNSSQICSRYRHKIAPFYGKSMIQYGTGEIGKAIALSLWDNTDVSFLGVCNSETMERKIWKYKDVELPLCNITEWKQYAPNAVILVVTMAKYHDEITKICESAGFQHIIPLDDDLQSALYGYEYCRRVGLN